MAWEALERLRVYTDESDTIDGRSAFSRIVEAAHEHGLAGATVFRGMMGYGGNSRIHTARLLELSSDLPVLVEIIDTAERIEEFCAVALPMLKKGLMTREPVTAHRPVKRNDESVG
ncbi:MAG: DUF190 domain-containing protein [Acidobacteriota bacterium]